MVVWLYATAIAQRSGEVVITATNGGPDGPPNIRFCVPPHVGNHIKINTRFKVTIEVEQ